MHESGPEPRRQRCGTAATDHKPRSRNDLSVSTRAGPGELGRTAAGPGRRELGRTAAGAGAEFGRPVPPGRATRWKPLLPFRHDRDRRAVRGDPGRRPLDRRSAADRAALPGRGERCGRPVGDRDGGGLQPPASQSSTESSRRAPTSIDTRRPIVGDLPPADRAARRARRRADRRTLGGRLHGAPPGRLLRPAGRSAQLLLDRGADPNAWATGSIRVQPLHSAVAGGHEAVARLLVERGAQPGPAPGRRLHAAPRGGPERAQPSCATS